MQFVSKVYYLHCKYLTVGFSCYSYMKLQVCTVIYYCYYHQTTRVQLGQCRMPLLLQAKYLQCTYGPEYVLPLCIWIKVSTSKLCFTSISDLIVLFCCCLRQSKVLLWFLQAKKDLQTPLTDCLSLI